MKYYIVAVSLQEMEDWRQLVREQIDDLEVLRASLLKANEQEHVRECNTALKKFRHQQEKLLALKPTDVRIESVHAEFIKKLRSQLGEPG